MLLRKELLGRPGPRDHFVQFCDDEESRVKTVGLFIREGLERGEAVLVVATRERQEALMRHLESERVDTIGAARRGQLVLMDAAETLARVVRGGQPDWDRFLEVVGHPLAALRRDGRFPAARAYGEMVDLLWQEGNLAGAVKLEAFWDRLLKDHPVALFCAYAIDILDGRVPVDALSAVLSSHSHLLPRGDTARLERAVVRAMEEILDPVGAAALRPLISASQSSRTALPEPEAVILWLRRNLPEAAGEVIARARAHYAGLPVPGRVPASRPVSPSTVLLVEDDPNDLLLVTHAFERSAPGVHLQVARDGEEAVGYLAGKGLFFDRNRHPAPDLVLLDIKLPRRSGLEVLEWIRNDPSCGHLPVIMLTSSREVQDIGRAMALGANSYVVKGVDMKSLREVTRGIGVYVSLLQRQPA